MIDSVNLYLPQSELNSVDLLAEIPNYLTNLREYQPERGGVAVKGTLLNMKVTVKEHGLFLEGSLPKYLKGNNIRTSNYQDVLLAFEKLSDELRICPKSLEEAKVRRVDYAATLAVNNPETDYFSYLGDKPFFNRMLFNESSLYYNSKAKNKRNQRQKLLFYSKAEELQAANDPNLKDYRNEKLLRYESSILKPKIYYKGSVNVGLLKDRQFHRQSINRWSKDYTGIKKLDALMKDFSMIKKPNDIYNYFLAVMAKDYGVEAIMKLPEEIRRHGRFDKAQYYSRLRNDLAKRLEQIQLGDRHELIRELDEKISSVASEQAESLMN